MPRQSRIELPGVPLHVTQRGVNRCATFIDDDDRAHYLRLLKEKSQKLAVRIHAYVLMSNHVHLLLSSDVSGAISHMMRHVGLSYVIAFNRRHQRTGTLWEGRFKSCLIDSEAYLLTVYRYIELNPVRAAMADDAQFYPWSSVHANLGTRHDPIVTPHEVFLSIASDPQQRSDAYRTWLSAGVDDEDLQRIRAHVRQERVLGNPKFQAMAEKALGRPVVLRKPGRPRRANSE
jgi:putative transposase